MDMNVIELIEVPIYRGQLKVINIMVPIAKCTASEKPSSIGRHEFMSEVQCLICASTSQCALAGVLDGDAKCPYCNANSGNLEEKSEFREQGEIFGYWRFDQKLNRVEIVEARKDPSREYILATCLCCNKQHTVRADIIRAGRSKGCLSFKNKRLGNPYANPSHKLYPIYTRLINVEQRTRNSINPNFKHYGGRGITVADQFSISYQAKTGLSRFAVDNLLLEVGLPPGENFDDYSIDRIDNDKGYVQGNVRWADCSTQVRNRKITSIIPIEGGRETTAVEFSLKHGLLLGTVNNRKRSGYSEEEHQLPIGGRNAEAREKNDKLIRVGLETGQYTATRDGDIFSFTKSGWHKLKPQKLEGSDYYSVRLDLTIDGERQSTRVLVHRIVAIQYLQNPDQLKVVGHRDDNPENNNVENLAWITHQGNSEVIHNNNFVYPENILQDIALCSESYVQSQISKLPDNSDYITSAHNQLIWSETSINELRHKLQEYPSKYSRSRLSDESIYSHVFTRFLAAPGNQIEFLDSDVTIILRKNNDEIKRVSVFDLRPTLEWSVYTVWYPEELEKFGLYTIFPDFPRIPLQDPRPVNIRAALDKKRQYDIDTVRMVIPNSVLIKNPEFARCLRPDPDGNFTHPLLITRGDKRAKFYFRCIECKKHIVGSFNLKSLLRHMPLCATHRAVRCRENGVKSIST